MIVRYVYFLIRSDDYVNTENQKSLFIYLKNDSGGFSRVKLMGMVKVFSWGFGFFHFVLG